MKFRLFPATVVLALGFLCGCGGPTMTFNNQTYHVLTKDEEQVLVHKARMLLLAPSKALTKEEVHFVQTKEPKVDIHYTGDRTGEAKVIWTMPKKIITMHFGEKLLTDSMGWSLETEKRMPEVLKFVPENQ